MSPPAGFSGLRRASGFTLIETLVVMIVAVGVVAMMGMLFRATAQTAVSLRAGTPEWMLQRSLRNQVGQAVLSGTATALPSIAGSAQELYVSTWEGRRDGLAGPPVLAAYRFDPAARRIEYREMPLPPWWIAGDGGQAARLRSDLSYLPATVVMSAVDDFGVRFAPAGRPAVHSESWPSAWNDAEPPRVVLVSFERAGRRYELWLEINGWAG